jgi:nucleoside-diphosphate-sugar epimerase
LRERARSKIKLLMDSKAGDRPSAYMDNTPIREEVGYRREHTVEREITEYIDWLRRHPE